MGAGPRRDFPLVAGTAPTQRCVQGIPSSASLQNTFCHCSRRLPACLASLCFHVLRGGLQTPRQEVLCSPVSLSVCASASPHSLWTCAATATSHFSTTSAPQPRLPMRCKTQPWEGKAPTPPQRGCLRLGLPFRSLSELSVIPSLPGRLDASFTSARTLAAARCHWVAPTTKEKRYQLIILCIKMPLIQLPVCFLAPDQTLNNRVP